MKEFILCAAIHIDDDQEHEEQPANIIYGFVISGRRHSDCYGTIKALCKITGSVEKTESIQKLATRERQGFITSNNRFVNREEGFKIAKMNNQIYHNVHDGSDVGILISEDLY